MKIIILLMLIAAVPLLISCQPAIPPQPEPDTPVSSDDQPTPSTPIKDEDKYTIAEIFMVDSVDALILESWPLQVNAVVTGNLPDGCTTIHRTESRREENRFYLKIFTIREKEAFCTEALVPFEEVIPLDVYGLPAGDYSIEAYGLTAEFSFDNDNIVQEPDDA